MNDAPWLQVVYGLAVAFVLYTYLGYPALLMIWSRLRPRPVKRSLPGQSLPTVSVVVAAHNEQHASAQRIERLARQVVEAGVSGEIVVVSDGSTDATAVEAKVAAGSSRVPVRVVELTENVGKAAALSVGCEVATNDVIALADARQTWADDALTRLLENFGDPEVGAVSGELFVESAPGVMDGVGLYWRYEKSLRKMESLTWSTVGVTGAISAVRRTLFRPIPSGTMLDDVYWPLQVAMLGHRVVFDGRAQAFDRLPEKIDAELRRKVRTLSGNFQLAVCLPGSMLPWRNPVWFAWYSHKLFRLAVPWAFLVAAVSAAWLGGVLYDSLLAAQVGATLFGLAGLWPSIGKKSRVAAAAGSFLMLNTAAWLAFWVWATGRTSRSWTKTVYAPVASPPLTGAAR